MFEAQRSSLGRKTLQQIMLSYLPMLTVPGRLGAVNEQVFERTIPTKLKQQCCPGLTPGLDTGEAAEKSQLIHFPFVIPFPCLVCKFEARDFFPAGLARVTLL